ncbi:hypothetical protein [Paraburkholderia bannensis]|nr:hypothetical protein [Paraburkholderia bannensis]
MRDPANMPRDPLHIGNGMAGQPAIPRAFCDVALRRERGAPA